jgi:rod shape-determining protein MreC
MKSLLNFLYKHNHWLLFLLLESISLVLLFSFNDFQGSIWTSSANAVSGRLFEARQKVTSYFGLREENNLLAAQNARLEEQLFALTQGIDSLRLVELTQKVEEGKPFGVIAASVVENSITRPDNYITINRGTADGVQPEMGVISSNGVVGVTFKCSRHYALIIPILNSKSNISCKLSDDSFGYLEWRGGDARTALLNGVQRYANIAVGDTVITSGHSTYFPKGLMVGTIRELEPSADNLLYNVTVALSTEFSNLRHVFVIRNHDTEERRELTGTINNPGK